MREVIVNPPPISREEGGAQPPASQSEYSLVVDRENFRILLRLMYMVGTSFEQSKLATRRSWGKHLLEDWRSLDLIADKVVEEG